MTNKPETAIARKIMQWIKSQGGDCWSVHGGMFQRKGEPDIDGWLPNGVHLKLEVKTETGRPSKLQIHRLRVYHQAGYCVGLVRSVADVEAVVNAYLTQDYEEIEDEWEIYRSAQTGTV